MEPQPVLRVTVPSQPSKNEKKAAAGRAGAAARKAKSERLERELAEAKEALRDPAFVADPPAAEAAPEAAPLRDKKEASMLYLGALVAAVGGLVYWSKFHRAEPPPPKEKKTTLKSSAGPAQQLKVAHNPHYME